MDAEPQIISEDVTMSPTIGALALALAKAQGMMKAAPMDSDNPYFKSKYANLATIWDTIRLPLSTNELALSQDPVSKNGLVGVVTLLMHSSGEWKQSRLMLKPVKDDPQGAGSCLTYARRYALSAIVGAVADEDDDGNAASQPKPEPRAARPAQNPTRAPEKPVAPAAAPEAGNASGEITNTDLLNLAVQAGLMVKQGNGYPSITSSKFGDKLTTKFKHCDLEKLTAVERVETKDWLVRMINLKAQQRTG